MMNKLNVAILGATGAVGQRFIQLLENHPWFQIAEVVGSSRSAGKSYEEAANWVLDGQPPQHVASMIVKSLDDELQSPLVFSALPKDAAKEIEVPLAQKGHVVCTNASTHRMDADVPLLLPEVNHEHLGMVDVQRQNRNWTTGALVANSNCTTMPVVMALKPLVPFGIQSVRMVSMQAISGAGYPGVSALDILDNIIPYVSGDENKMETETLKMLGAFNGEVFEPLQATTSASCNRVPVIDGHLVNIGVSFVQDVSQDDILAAWNNFSVPDELATLPSAPYNPIQYLPQIDRPQIRRDRNAGNGMTTSIGRLETCPILGYTFSSLTHNTIRGAAGSSVINAELMAVRGYIDGFSVGSEQ